MHDVAFQIGKFGEVGASSASLVICSAMSSRSHTRRSSSRTTSTTHRLPSTLRKQTAPTTTSVSIVFAEPEQGSPLASALTKLPTARTAEMEMVQGITIADMDGKDVDVDADVDVLGGTLSF